MSHTIAIVDDHNLFADGLERILQDQKDIQIVAKCSSAEIFKTKLNEVVPQLLLLDIRLKGQNGLELCREIKNKMPFVKVILISMFESADVIEEATRSGADGYLPKSSDADLVKSTIQDVLNGNKVFIKPSGIPSSNEQVRLSNREKEIIQLLKQGLNTREISEKIFISQYTVETHKKNIFRKLEVKSSVELLSLFMYKDF